MFSNRERRKMEMRMGGPEMAGAPRDLGQSPSTGQPSLPRKRKARGTRAAKPASGRQPSAFARPLWRTPSSTELGRNVPFYQTNPPIFGSKTGVINLRYNG